MAARRSSAAASAAALRALSLPFAACSDARLASSRSRSLAAAAACLSCEREQQAATAVATAKPPRQGDSARGMGQALPSMRSGSQTEGDDCSLAYPLALLRKLCLACSLCLDAASGALSASSRCVDAA